MVSTLALALNEPGMITSLATCHFPASNFARVPQLLWVCFLIHTVKATTGLCYRPSGGRGVVSHEGKVLKTVPHEWQGVNNVGYFHRKLVTTYIIWEHRHIQTAQIFLKSNLTMCLESLKSVSIICGRNLTFRNTA